MTEFSLIGKTLGNYQVLEEIGRGGMAVVYQAYQPSLNRYVAIKVLPPQLTFDQQFVERFRREARAAAGLHHPNIVVIYDVGEQGGVDYIVMEYLEGQTLAQLIEREGALVPARAARFVDQVASALDYAHHRGFVHRDVKPANIFVREGDRVTLTDFGIAQAAWGTRLTQTGMLVGTPEYMSPEQAEGETVDHRTDLYALGVTLYQMLTGQVPFQGLTPHATLHKVVYEPPPPPRQLNPQLSPAVETVVLKALAKRPEERFQTGRALAEALRRAQAGAAVQVPSTAKRPARPAPRERPDRRPLVVTLGIVALILVGLSGWFLLSPTPPGPELSGLAATGTAQAATGTAVALGNQAQTPADSADFGARATEEAYRSTESALQATAGAAQWQATMTAAAAQATQVAIAATEMAAAAEATQAAIAATQTAAARPTASSAPSPTFTPTRPPTPGPTPADTPIPPTLTCALSVDPQLASAWDRDRLGCPTAHANTVWAAWEPFERGYMLWRSDTDKIHVLYFQGGSNSYAGDWWLTPDGIKWDGSNPEGVGLSPPPGLYEPLRGFGWLWRTHLGGPNSRSGWATDEEKGFCANIQPFESGLLFHSSTVTYCQDQLFNWATHPSFTTLLFGVYGDSSWRRY